MLYSHHLFHQEYILLYGKKDDESNAKHMKSNNASSVSNTYYGNNNKDCGTNSVDK